MSHWRVEQHYGFGAGRIPIQAEPHRAGRASLREGLAAIGEELTDGGPAASARRIAGEMPALLLGLLLVFAFIATLSRDHSDVSPIEVVLLESVPLEPEPIFEEPIVEIPEPVVPEPPPVVAPKPPPPPPQKLAERPKPPPPPPAKPKARPRPKPAIPQIARVEPPPAPVPARPDRPVRVRPDLAPKPRVAMESLAPTPTPRPSRAPERMERMARAPVERRITPALHAPTAPTPDLSSDAPPPPRAFRVAKANTPAGPRPKAIPGIAPAPPSPALAAAPPDRRMARASTSRATPTSRFRAPTPALDAPAVAPAAPAPSTPSRRREARPAPTAQTRRGPRLEAAPARAPRAPSAPPPAVPNRVARAAAELPQGGVSDRPGLAGVPLGDLAACVSDREEDRLKQAVVAAVTTQKECVSRAGSYRFIETKNLNAFLMWIDRASSRVVEDRCGELRHALECLENANRRAAR